MVGTLPSTPKSFLDSSANSVQTTRNLSFENFSSKHIHQWHLTLEEFDYGFNYTPEKDNVIADMIYLDHGLLWTNKPSIKNYVLF